MAEKYNLEDYETVEMRLKRLYEKFPQARVLTDMVYRDERSFIVKAEIYFDYNDLTPVATGFAEEIVGVGFVNKTSALENCETSAVGRAIGNSALGTLNTGKRPSQQEMEKVERYKATPRKVAAAPVVTYTEQQTLDAEILLSQIGKIAEVNELKDIWHANTEILNAPVKGTTVKDAINKRVKELQA